MDGVPKANYFVVDPSMKSGFRSGNTTRSSDAPSQTEKTFDFVIFLTICAWILVF